MDKASIARVILLVISVINLFLEKTGYSPIPSFLGELTAEFLVAVFALASAWKNNYLSKKGQAQKEQLEKVGLK